MNNISLIVEFENATLKGMEELQDFLQSLKREISLAYAGAPAGSVEILCVHPGGEAIDSSAAIQAMLELVRRDFHGIADVRVMEVAGARYYELKNEAARQARGDVIVFIDSDTIVSEGWLKNILAPFADPEIMVSAGLTAFLTEDFISRTFALTWYFPLVNDSDERLNKRGLVANNIAFRRHWFVANPYPPNEGFKVSCTLHNREIKRQGVKVARPRAVAHHRFWDDGLPFIMWRAAVSGRDADRKFYTKKGQNIFRRSARAIAVWSRRMVSVPARILRDHGKVGMPVYEVPFAILLSWFFFSIVGVSQLISALGLRKTDVEYLPGRFQIH